MKYTDEEIIAWLANDLDDDTRAAISNWVAASDEAQKRVAEIRSLEQMLSSAIAYEPPAELLYAYREMIAEEKESSTNGQNWYRVAAAIVLLIAGFGIGRYTVTPVQSGGELAGLQNEVRTLQQLVMLNTLREHTASERLQTINVIEDTPAAPDRELISVLAQTMDNDKNSNVRFAAVQALGRYIDQEDVRVLMARSLGDQDDPLVQIAIINTLVIAQEKTAIAPISKIAANEDAPEEVRRTAEMALDILI